MLTLSSILICSIALVLIEVSNRTYPDHNYNSGICIHTCNLIDAGKNPDEYRAYVQERRDTHTGPSPVISEEFLSVVVYRL